MTITELEPETSGAAPGPGRLKHAGTDDRCSKKWWESWYEEGVGRCGKWVQCPDPATDTVNGELYCSPHADEAAGI